MRVARMASQDVWHRDSRSVRNSVGSGAGLSHQAGHVHHAGSRRQQPGRGDAHRRRSPHANLEAADRRAQPPGAGGLIAAQAAAGVEKDGYTLYMTQASTFTVLPIEQEGKMPVNLQTAFVPIGMVGEQPIAVAVNKDVPANNIAELIALANKTPGGMLFGATNRGGQSHLTGELFRDRSKANISFVHAAGAAVSRTMSSPDASRSYSRAWLGWRPDFRAAAFGLLALPRRSACPTCRTCPRSTKPCRAWCRADGSC